MLYKCKGDVCIRDEQNKVWKKFDEILLEIFFEERRWLHANPSIYTDPNYRKMLSLYIQETESLKEKVNELFQELVEGEAKVIFIKGKRGVGKTTFLNYFLNTRTKKSEEYNNIETLNDKGLTWVRIDATKIYRQILTGINFQKYLYGQILYVYFRYKDTPEIRGGSRSGKLKSVPDKVFQKVDLLSKIKKDKKLEHDYKDAEKLSKAANNFEDSLVKPYDYEELAEILLNALKDKIILFVDGIDNLDYGTFLKKNALDDFKNFILKNTEYFHKIVISGRYEIIENLKQEFDKNKNYGSHNSSTIELTIEQPLIDNIIGYFKHKMDQIKKKNSSDNLSEEDFNKIKNELKIFIGKFRGIIKENSKDSDGYVYKHQYFTEIKKGGIIDKILLYLGSKEKEALIDDLEYFVKFYIQTFQKELKKFEGKEKEDESEKLIIEFFDYDFRELILNIINCFFYLRADYHRRIINVFSSFSFKEYLNQPKTKKILKSAILKNGSLYGNNYDEILYTPPYRNIAFINIFNIFNKKEKYQEYPPLIYYLVLLKLSKNMKEDKLDDWFKSLSRKYKELEELEEIKAKFMEFGYLDYRSRLTFKGKYVVKNIFQNIHFLHINVYNALLQENLINLIKPYKSDFSDYINKTLENIAVVIYDLCLQINSLEDISIKDVFDDESKTKLIESIRLYLTLLKKTKSEYSFVSIFDAIRNNCEEKCKCSDEKCQEECRELVKEIKECLLQFMSYMDVEKINSYDFTTEEKFVILYQFLDLSIDDIKNNMKYLKILFGKISQDNLEIYQNIDSEIEKLQNKDVDKNTIFEKILSQKK